MKQAIVIGMALALAGCAGGFGGDRGRDAPEIVTVAPGEDVTRPTERPEDSPAESGADFRGLTVASLGDASVPGVWVETPLVTEETTGRVIGENGQQVAVTLRPSGGERGSGSRMSLAAYQALGIPLTALPTVTVIVDA